MFKHETTAPTAKQSSRVQNRRRTPRVLNFLQKLNLRVADAVAKEPDFGFAKEHGGRLYCKLIGRNIYQVKWENPDTGQSVLAFGCGFISAYENLKKNYNEKYVA